MSKVLRFAPSFPAPIDIVTQTLLLVGKRGAGKSTSATVIVEEVAKVGVQFCVLDGQGVWWGLRSSADGKGPGIRVYIFGGLHGDLPLEPTSGKLMARVLVETGISAVFDFTEFDSEEGKRRFVADFAEELFRLKSRNPSPIMVVVEEAEEFVPQQVRGESARMVGAMQRLWKRGRSRGIGLLAIVQRLASLHKDATTQSEILIAHQTVGPQDRDALFEWIKYHHQQERKDEFLATLGQLHRGEAWIWSPEFLDAFTLIQFRNAQTFDSRRTPKVGEVAVTPTQTAVVDLEKLRAQMNATIERNDANDPAKLRARIISLENELKRRDPAGVSRVVEKRVEVEVAVLPDGYLDSLKGLIDVATTISEGAAELHKVVKLLPRSVGKPGSVATVRPAPAEGGPRPHRYGLVPPDRVAAPLAVTREKLGIQMPFSRETLDDKQPGGEVSRPQQKVLDSLRWLESVGLTPTTIVQAAFISGYALSSKGFNNILSAMRGTGLVNRDGPGLVSLTEAGRRLSRAPEIAPDEESLQQAILGKLGGSQARILKVLIEAREPISRVKLAVLAGWEGGPKGFANCLSQLRSLGAIEYLADGEIGPSAMLFLQRAS